MAKLTLQLCKRSSAKTLWGGGERFGLFWPGKTQAIRAAQIPTTATLTPDHETSLNWDETQNVVIEGDNLEVLKILQKHYYGKIKMIYIDPPYNTGNDFVYEDDYADPIGTYLDITGQRDGEGKLSTNTESAGRFHSNWLNMMYPRLKLARNLLREDGVIFLSIDSGEVSSLRQICNEIFGEQNFVADVIWQKKYTQSNDVRRFSENHDHILCFARSARFYINPLPRSAKQLKTYRNRDNDPRGPWKATPLHAKSGSSTSEFTFPNGIRWQPPVGTYRRFSDQRMLEMFERGEIWFGEDQSLIPQRKSFLSQVKEGVAPVTIWQYEEVGHNHEANDELKGLGLGGVFNNPKPTRLLRRILQIATNEASLVLDFFAGSGTTAHAVMALNAEDGGNRRCISVQLPEPTDEKSEACKAGYKTISEITRERVRCAGKKILEEKASTLDGRAESLDVGFRAYKLVDTNFTKWRADSSLDADELSDLFTQMHESANDHARPEALLTEILLKLGFSLTEQVKGVDVAGLHVFNVMDGLVMAYLDEHTKPTLEQLRALVVLEPERLVILEDAFQDDDELKTNLVQECRTHGVDLWTA